MACCPSCERFELARARFAPKLKRAAMRRRRDLALASQFRRWHDREHGKGPKLGFWPFDSDDKETPTSTRTGGFVGGKAPGQVAFETIVRAIPKCATEADLVRAMRQAIGAFPEARSSTLGALRAAATDPRRRLQTTASGTYCVASPQRQAVWKAITAAFQGHAAEIAIDEVQRQAFKELTEEVSEKLDPRRGLWETIWGAVKPVALPVGIAGGTLLALRFWPRRSPP